MFLTILVHGQEILCKISTKPWGGVVLRGARSFYFFSISLGLSNIKKKITLRGSLSIHLKRKLILSNRKNLKNQSQPNKKNDDIIFGIQSVNLVSTYFVPMFPITLILEGTEMGTLVRNKLNMSHSTFPCFQLKNIMFSLKSYENLWFSDDFSGNRS